MNKFEIEKYDKEKGLDMKNQFMDCAHTKPRLRGLETGSSTVDRKKIGTRRSVIVEGNGIGR